MASLVIGVPGSWRSPTHAVAALAKQRIVWSPHSGLAVDAKTRQPYPFVIEKYDHDPRMRRAFEAVGRLDRRSLQRIESHTMTLYVVSNAPHDVETSFAAMQLAAKLLDAGGIAAKVETAGVGHSAKRWRDLCALGIPALATYHALTIRNAPPDLEQTYSCGMHHLALPDVIVKGASAEHLALLDAFNKYQALEQPVFKDGQTFSIAADAPRYKLKHVACRLWRKSDLFHNPFGVWRLSRLRS